ncbi:tellurite resistance/C4-dicarboxylate transporter family protein [Mycolicibacterium wolinskyi]|uniref:tellurite resistance/C4-dicarboxylate transporter family protein n=1 Tax=Mycolicibacterium wolinskyi TaxID=59750 RepID=UPI00391778B6
MKPEAFAAVMATGIVSVAAADHGLDALSVALAVLATVALPVLMCLAASRWRTCDLRDLDTVIALFTYVAACSVLAARFAEHRWAVWLFGAMALPGWLLLMPMTVARMRRLGVAGLRNRARGTWELASVATSGLAIVAVATGTVSLAFVFWVLALCVYCVMTALIAWRALGDSEVRRDVPPDHWILMGGVAIATLAGERIHAELAPGAVADAVRAVTVCTLAVATVQIVPLARTGWRRMLDWPAVFPLGMYSAASYAVAVETGWHLLVVVSLVFFWAAFLAWSLVVAAQTRQGVRLISEHGLRPK